MQPICYETMILFLSKYNKNFKQNFTTSSKFFLCLISTLDIKFSDTKFTFSIAISYGPHAIELMQMVYVLSIYNKRENYQRITVRAVFLSI